jgi:hypothetical protein
MPLPAVEQTLREYGLRYNAERKQWEGLDYVICDEDIEHLTVADIDQIVAGLRDGRDSVTLGPDKEFRLELE